MSKIQNHTFFNRILFFVIIAVQAVIVNAALVPISDFEWFGNMFSCVPFHVSAWIIIIGLAVTMILVDILRKFVTRSNKSIFETINKKDHNSF